MFAKRAKQNAEILLYGRFDILLVPIDKALSLANRQLVHVKSAFPGNNILTYGKINSIVHFC